METHSNIEYLPFFLTNWTKYRSFTTCSSTMGEYATHSTLRD